VASSDSGVDSNCIICFKWDFKRLRSVFKNPEHGRVFENGIYSLWLKSISDYILRQSKEIFEYKVKKQEIKETIRRASVLSPSAKQYSETHPNFMSSSSSSATDSEEEVCLSYSNAKQGEPTGLKSKGKFHICYVSDNSPKRMTNPDLKIFIKITQVYRDGVLSKNDSNFEVSRC